MTGSQLGWARLEFNIEQDVHVEYELVYYSEE